MSPQRHETSCSDHDDSDGDNHNGPGSAGPPTSAALQVPHRPGQKKTPNRPGQMKMPHRPGQKKMPRLLTPSPPSTEISDEEQSVPLSDERSYCSSDQEGVVPLPPFDVEDDDEEDEDDDDEVSLEGSNGRNNGHTAIPIPSSSARLVTPPRSKPAASQQKQQQRKRAAPKNDDTVVVQSNLMSHSVGRTRKWLNENLDFVGLKLFAKFGQCTFGTRTTPTGGGGGGTKTIVYHLTLNDGWNELVTTTQQEQIMYVGKTASLSRLSTRDKAAQALADGAVANNKNNAPPHPPLALFLVPKQSPGPKQLFYVGQWRVMDAEHYVPPKTIWGKPRQTRLSLRFVEWDKCILRAVNGGSALSQK